MPHIPGTDLCVSRLGLGSYNWAGAFGPVQARDFTRLIQVAYAKGVTFFDTAPTYGEGEVGLGRALAHVRSQVVLSSKLCLPPDTAGVETAVITSCEQSLRRLNTDYLDLYHLHYDPDMIPQAPLVQSLEKLQETGKIRYFGLTHASAHRLDHHAKPGLFSTLLLELHPLAAPAHRRMMDKASSLSCIGYGVTGRGLFTGRFNRTMRLAPDDIRHHDPLFQRENLTAGRRIVNYLLDLGRHLEKTPAQLVIAWALAQRGVASVLTTTSSEAHLRENLEGAHYQWPVGAWAEFTAFLNRVWEEMSRLRADTIAHLLSQPLAREISTARGDLNYLIACMYSNGVAPAHRLVPLWLQLQGTEDPYEVEAIFQRLQRLDSPGA